MARCFGRLQDIRKGQGGTVCKILCQYTISERGRKKIIKRTAALEQGKLFVCKSFERMRGCGCGCGVLGCSTGCVCACVCGVTQGVCVLSRGRCFSLGSAVILSRPTPTAILIPALNGIKKTGDARGLACVRLLVFQKRPFRCGRDRATLWPPLPDVAR